MAGAVRTYYGVERVSVAGPKGTRLAGTVSGVAGGRVVVALDEPSEFYPVGYTDVDEDGNPLGKSIPIPGLIAQVLEPDMEFFVDGSDTTAPSFSPEQLAYLRRTYGEQAEAVVSSEGNANAARPDEDDTEDDEPDEATLRAAAAAAVQAQGGGLSPDKVAAAKLPDGA